MATEAAWMHRLRYQAGVVLEELLALRGPQAVAVDPADALAAVLRADAPPWQDATPEERDAFKEQYGRSLEDVMRAAFDPLTLTARPAHDPLRVIPEEDDSRREAMQLLARKEMLLLIGWDFRYVEHPTAKIVIRNAQLAGDQEFMRDLGAAAARNLRYAHRGMRGQRMLSRLITAYAFGDKRAYANQKYRDLVYEKLVWLFTDAGVPMDDRAWKALNDRNYFNKHLSRLGFEGP